MSHPAHHADVDAQFGKVHAFAHIEAFGQARHNGGIRFVDET